MPAHDSPAIIVARFLQANHYDDTLESFLKEAGLPSDAGNTEKGDLTIERILEEKKTFDLSVSFEKLGTEDKCNEWSLPAPSIPYQISLPSSANLLHVSIDSLRGSSTNQFPRQLLFATTSDRCLNFIEIENDFTLFKSLTHIQDSPILSCILLDTQPEGFVTISSGMSGQVIVYDHKSDKILEERRDHSKYVVKIAHCHQPEQTWIATAGWDSKVYLYHLEQVANNLGAPVASLTLPTNPDTITFVPHPDNRNEYLLLLTRRDSTSLYFYRLPQNPSASTPPPALELLGSQNLAPHSNNWVAFTPSSVAVCPTDSSLVAVVTSTVPHMKLLIVRLLLPPVTSSTPDLEHTSSNLLNAHAATANLALQDREDAAILVHVSTLAPQTPYSTPQVVWRPDGSGVWVNGDDGVIRGLAAATGKVEAVLKGGHEEGSKVRSLWCGRVDVMGREERKEEWVVSGGFDRRLVVWKPEKASV